MEIGREFIKHLPWGEVTVEYNAISSGKGKTVMDISRKDIKVCTLPPVINSLILVYWRSSRTYVTDEIESVQDCCIGQLLADGHIDLLEELTVTYEANEDVKYCWLVVDRNKRKGCVEAYFFPDYVLVRIWNDEDPVFR